MVDFFSRFAEPTVLAPILGELAIWLVGPPLLLLAVAGFGMWAIGGRNEELRLPYAVGAGALTLITLVAMANMLVPISRSTGLLLIPAGLLSFLAWRKSQGIDWPATFVFSSVAVAAVSLLVFPSRPRLQYDVFLYHGPLLEWMAREPVPQGLGLLHTRFAFNPGLLLLTGALRTPFGGWTHHAIVEAAVVGFAAATIASVLFAMRRSDDRRLTAFIIAIMGLGGCGLALQRFHSGTDIAVGVTLLASVAVTALVANANRIDEGMQWSGLLVMLIAFSVVQKASAIPAVVLLLVLRPFLRTRFEIIHFLRMNGASISVAAGASTALVARTYVMSGCLLYPVSVTCRGVSWGIGPERATVETGVIRSWARDRTVAVPDLMDFSWLGTWFAGYVRNPQLLLVVLGVAAGVLGLLIRRPPDVASAPRIRLGLIVAYTGAGFGFWFLMAPDPRFGFHLHVVLAALLATPLLERILSRDWEVPSLGIRRRPTVGQRNLGAAVLSLVALFVLAVPLAWHGRSLPLLPTSPGSTLDLVERSLPLEGDAGNWVYFTPSAGDQCRDAFPCAPRVVDLVVDVSGRRTVFFRPRH